MSPLATRRADKRHQKRFCVYFIGEADFAGRPANTHVLDPNHHIPRVQAGLYPATSVAACLPTSCSIPVGGVQRTSINSTVLELLTCCQSPRLRAYISGQKVQSVQQEVDRLVFVSAMLEWQGETPEAVEYGVGFREIYMFRIHHFVVIRI
jgi:hypothetical protein